MNVNTKVIVLGSSYLYHLLYTWDDEFREIFKVRADFNPVMQLNRDHQLAYGRWVGNLCAQEGLPHFNPSAVEKLIEFGVRRAGDREKILASYSDIADVVREAGFWARKQDRQLVSAEHVDAALKSRVYRSNRVEEEIREMIANGTILVDAEEKRSGR